jgi:uroporphyrinogen-III synthase
MRELPLAENEDALRFAHDLIAGCFDLVIFLTGTGAKALLRVIAEAQSAEDFLQALRRVSVAVRGPKPQAVLREWNVPTAVVAPEPCTWRELLCSLEQMPAGLLGQRVAVQEYGSSNPEFLEALKERGAIVQAVAVYQWALPENTGPLREAISSTIKGEIDAALFTTGIQVAHLFQLAGELGHRDELRMAFTSVMVASIGPATSEALRNVGIHVDLEPSHPKMGVLVKEAAERSGEILAFKASRN